MHDHDAIGAMILAGYAIVISFVCFMAYFDDENNNKED